MQILICDDHKIVREGLKQILQQHSHISHIQEAATGQEAINLLAGHPFDILLLDISLPDKNGLEVLQTARSRFPATHVLMLSMHSQEQYALRTLKLGASGYLTKDSASEELLLAIKKVSTGGRYIAQSLAESLAFFSEKKTFRHQTLSSREFEIMIQLANGTSLREIGERLCISDKTVSTYRSRIMKKMQLQRNTELTRYCIENKLI